ncbi:efflux RND transporter periplasmic adaptor subunit [Proteiniphilum sp. X52]|uniref:efflux RND transporter periplasmic adaptor subunit n=1 Tax=Proteiniphilum sp. X52 TaxID=2382159 RepID=UPI000F0A78A4|nr:efflux RND transporter periplasmic adaptor subunit [Proteiniphilum sp. X52]RNC63795.1 efflux RND transporter periplasmic adaptor subunit [Proteiniphilum sp. X52]
MKHNHIFILTLSISLFAACKADKDKNSENNVQQLLPDRPAEVTTMTLTAVDFEHELVSNGKISAQNVAELKFLTAEVIAAIYVRNGSRVEKGQPIAILHTYSLTNALNQTKDALDRSKLEYQDVLIGQGYRLDNPQAVPKEVEELARVKSGYNTAQTQYDMAVYNLEQATLTAPISGVIANLFAKPNTLSSPSAIFCNIIDTRSLEATFTVMENELVMIRTGDKIKVTPFSMPGVEIEGRVSEINPWVDKNGMVQVKASVGYHERMVEGMNVRVSIFRSLGKQWVVPKSAVVLRTGKQVVFTLQDGKALWNYVQTGLENASSYTITGETLKEGDRIITSGNINLAHESPVTVIDEIQRSGDSRDTTGDSNATDD